MTIDKAREHMRKNLASREFNLITLWLREVSSGSRVNFLREVIDHSVIWRLVKSTINDRGEALEIYKLGLDRIQTANSQMTKKWVEFGVIKLGARRAIRELAQRLDSQPHVVDMALYWLPSFCEGSRSSDDIKQLQLVALDKGVIRPSVSDKLADGKVILKDRYEK